MASSGIGEEQNAIREGFLCPICLTDLGDVSQLQTHFTRAHSSGETLDNDIVLQFKGLFGKAKQRLLQFDSIVGDRVPTDGSRKMQSFVSVETQLLGAVQSHTAYFRSVRDSHVDQFAVETNNLIIRLDKLVNQCPADPARRKEFEQEIVPWKQDTDAKMCLTCKSRFGLTRRRHHCRLCGSIICHQCSDFLTFLVAKRLTNPVGFESSTDALVTVPSAADQRSTGDSGSSTKASPVRRNAQRLMRGAERLMTLSAVLKRDGSEVSVGSFLNQDGDEHVRICRRCRSLLGRRDEQMESRQQPPLVVQMYDRLRALMADASAIYPSYYRMTESLCSGESMYSLQTAKEMRLKMLKLQEQIDFTSKRILAIGSLEKEQQETSVVPDDEKAPKTNPKELLLQRNIRQFAAIFLQELILGVPNLPTEEDYLKLQRNYKEKLRLQIERERAQAAAMADQQSVHPHRPQTVISSSVSVPGQLSGGGRLTRGLADHRREEGWTADTQPIFQYNPFDDDEQQQIDPLQQQILIIKGYLRQAAEAGRLEEVEMLEQNLRELQQELKQQHLDTPRTEHHSHVA